MYDCYMAMAMALGLMGIYVDIAVNVLVWFNVMLFCVSYN